MTREELEELKQARGVMLDSLTNLSKIIQRLHQKHPAVIKNPYEMNVAERVRYSRELINLFDND